jgi:hypothetical protein
MNDLLYLAVGVGFFALSWGFVKLCAALEDKR